jgi:hypothetical protein
MASEDSLPGPKRFDTAKPFAVSAAKERVTLPPCHRDGSRLLSDGRSKNGPWSRVRPFPGHRRLKFLEDGIEAPEAI